MKNEVDFKHGGLYRLREDLFITYEDPGHRQGILNMIRKMVIPKGEILEFRYNSPAHFRDRFSFYFPVHESQYHKFEHVAQIYENVSSDNRANLDDILRLHLYKSVIKGEYTFSSIPTNIKEHFEGVYIYGKKIVPAEKI